MCALITALYHRLLANITRCFFWLGDHFELALLFQSLFMIVAQVRYPSHSSSKLHILTCKPSVSIAIYLHIVPPKNKSGERRDVSKTFLILAMANIHSVHRVSRRIYVSRLPSSSSSSPLPTIIRLCQAILFLIFGRSEIFVAILGFVALGLESTLPIPQLLRCVFYPVRLSETDDCRSNFKQKSLYGFRMSTLVGWVGGDAFKLVALCSVYSLSDGAIFWTMYFCPQNNPLQFKVCAIFQLSIDFGKPFAPDLHIID